MSDPIVKSPFSDQVGKPAVPHKGTGKGTYDHEPNIPLPGRDGGLLPELYRDDLAKDPSLTGPITSSPFKDAVD